MQFYAGSSLIYTSPANPTGQIVSAVAVPSGLCTLRVSARQDWVQVWAQGTLLFEGTFYRASARYQPTIKYTASAGSTTTITVVNMLLGTAKPVTPSLTDFDMYGSTTLINPGGYDNQYSLPSGGQGAVHPASPAFEAIHKPVLDRANFALATSGVRPTQATTAAGAIAAVAGLVELTGPASGSYAITLAAPRVQDAGRTLLIEMPAAAGGSVTMALTNVTGGTASTTCTWTAAKSKLLLVAGAAAWEVAKQDGVTLA